MTAALDRDRGEIAAASKSGVEGEVHVAVERHVPARAPAVVLGRALEEAEVADVVRRAVGPRLGERIAPRGGQRGRRA